MSELPIDANIREIGGGPYYPVKLHALPKAGELIELYSFIDAAAKPPPKKFYEVVQVVHQLHDVSDKIWQSKGGSHFVTVFVKPSQSEFLQSPNLPEPPVSWN